MSPSSGIRPGTWSRSAPAPPTARESSARSGVRRARRHRQAVDRDPHLVLEAAQPGRPLRRLRGVRDRPQGRDGVARRRRSSTSTRSPTRDPDPLDVQASVVRRPSWASCSTVRRCRAGRDGDALRDDDAAETTTNKVDGERHGGAPARAVHGHGRGDGGGHSAAAGAAGGRSTAATPSRSTSCRMVWAGATAERLRRAPTTATSAAPCSTRSTTWRRVTWSRSTAWAALRTTSSGRSTRRRLRRHAARHVEVPHLLLGLAT